MANEILIHDTVTGTCGKAILSPKSEVVSTDDTITVTSSTDATGKITYNLSSQHPDLIGSGSATVTQDTVTGNWTVDASDISATVIEIDNGDGTKTYTFQNTDENGVAVGLPVNWTVSEPHELISYTQGAVDTVAAVAAGANDGVDFSSTGFLTTNKAFEAGATGVRNEDGGLGHQSPFRGINQVLSYNGATFWIQSNTVLPDGKYEGHVMKFMALGAPTDVWELSHANLFGVARSNTGAIEQLGGTGSPMYVRQQESGELIWDGIGWEVINFNHRLLYGAGYAEQEDGRVRMWGTSTFTPGSQDIRVGVPLPAALNTDIGYFNAHVSLQDITWAGAPGEPLPTTGANNGIADREHETDMGWAPSTVSPSTEFIIIAFQEENLPGENLGLISWKLTVEGGLL